MVENAKKGWDQPAFFWTNARLDPGSQKKIFWVIRAGFYGLDPLPVCQTTPSKHEGKM